MTYRDVHNDSVFIGSCRDNGKGLRSCLLLRYRFFHFHTTLLFQNFLEAGHPDIYEYHACLKLHCVNFIAKVALSFTCSTTTTNICVNYEMFCFCSF